MYEDQIEIILNKDTATRACFVGALARNELKTQQVKYPSCMIINNEPRAKPGGHWLALAYTADRRAYFFDSYGLAPACYRLESFLNQTSNSWDYNKLRIQGSSE